MSYPALASIWPSYFFLFLYMLIYSQFHKTLPKSLLQMHWISVRFYEMCNIKRRTVGHTVVLEDLRWQKHLVRTMGKRGHLKLLDNDRNNLVKNWFFKITRYISTKILIIWYCINRYSIKIWSIWNRIGILHFQQNMRKLFLYKTRSFWVVKPWKKSFFIV